MLTHTKFFLVVVGSKDEPFRSCSRRGCTSPVRLSVPLVIVTLTVTVAVVTTPPVQLSPPGPPSQRLWAFRQPSPPSSSDFLHGCSSLPHHHCLVGYCSAHCTHRRCRRSPPLHPVQHRCRHSGCLASVHDPVTADFGQTDFGQLFGRLWPVVGLTDFGHIYCFSVLATFSQHTKGHPSGHPTLQGPFPRTPLPPDRLGDAFSRTRLTLPRGGHRAPGSRRPRDPSLQGSAGVWGGGLVQPTR